MQASAEHVEKRTGRWARVTPIDDTSCLLEMDAVHPGWAAFGLGVVDAPFTLEEATPEVLAVLRLWSARFTEAAEGCSASPD